MRSQGQVTDKQRRISMFNYLYNSEDFAIITIITLRNKEQTKVLLLCKIFFACADVFIHSTSAT